MEFIIYTDGGCSGNKRDAGCYGAYAYVILDAGKNVIYKGKGDGRNTTNNRMEMMAAIEALSKMKTIISSYGITIRMAECVVITDSQYVVNNFYDYLDEWKKRNWRKSGGGPVINDDLWKRLDALIPEFKSVKFKWVKGHANNEYNEMADQMVRSVLYPTA